MPHPLRPPLVLPSPIIPAVSRVVIRVCWSVWRQYPSPSTAAGSATGSRWFRRSLWPQYWPEPTRDRGHQVGCGGAATTPGGAGCTALPARPLGAPSASTFLRVLRLLDARAVAAAFGAWLKAR